MNVFAGQEQRCRCRERACGHGGEEGSGMNWEIQIDMYTLLCVKQIASGNLLYNTGSSAQCSVMTQMDRVGGGREGIYVYIQLIHLIVQQKLTQHCKATILQIKKKERKQYIFAWHTSDVAIMTCNSKVATWLQFFQ